MSEVDGTGTAVTLKKWSVQGLAEENDLYHALADPRTDKKRSDPTRFGARAEPRCPIAKGDLFKAVAVVVR